ncbi:MAG: hypothetical protein OXC19_02265 [Bryobacterales bacterium]|nr:hypothetical protein [Bryobacterales bacterium]
MDFLGGYGTKGVLAERIVKIVLVSVAVTAMLGALYYVFFRNWREERYAKRFFEQIRAEQYEEAYRLWGCSAEEPCRYYPYDEFLEDWGPDAPYGKLNDYSLGRSYTQPNGVILRYSINGEEGDPLWIELAPPKINFAPN